MQKKKKEVISDNVRARNSQLRSYQLRNNSFFLFYPCQFLIKTGK